MTTQATPAGASALTRMWGHLRSLCPDPRDYAKLRTTWWADVAAGVTVGIVALPLALGFGVSSGLSASEGLITAIVAGFLAAVFGGSNVQVSGPTGAMVVVLLPIVASHGAGAVAVVAILAGLLVALAGLLKLGRTVGVIPWPVIEGFTLGIGVIIFLQQVPSVMSPGGVGGGGLSTNALIAALQSIAQAEWDYVVWALGITVVVVVSMLVAGRIHPSVPGSLLGIVVATILCVVLPAPLAVIGALPSGLPAPSLPTVAVADLPDLMGPVVAVAALAAIESLLSARVAASMANTGPYSPDRELVGQGIASMGSGLFGGMPATGAIARTAVNVRAGARTRLASVVHAVVLLCVVLFAAGPVGMIPLAALAGILMLTAWRMVNWATVRSIMRSTRADAAAFLLTAIVTVAFDLIVAVIIGVVVAGFFAIRNLARETRVTREAVPGEPEPGDERIAVVRFDGPLIFASGDRVFDEVMAFDGIRVVVLRMSSVEVIDATGAHVLEDIVTSLERRGVTVLIKGVQARHEELFRTVGVLPALRHVRHLFDDLDEAVEHARSHIEREGLRT
ncbi:sulfate permease, SulP family [Brevibacterium jeotgali]|uniref:Sulfate permease, SulP family n=2 Tax=Brevibacterium jeotgali TaxID=1262550 RepID=A0A2H1L4D9_9MICO|nr:SulP family sulfate permease [Brevibacterium jeotgali]SMY11761.1 sulfate permease, SulP family [Brevibacterium jeotgali]